MLSLLWKAFLIDDTTGIDEDKPDKWIDEDKPVKYSQSNYIFAEATFKQLADYLIFNLKDCTD